jgi:predicted metal-binding membrane protein
MLILIGVGAMNLTVMLVLAGVILLEKYWTRGVALSRITALAAFGLAVFVLAFPQLTGFSAM